MSYIRLIRPERTLLVAASVWIGTAVAGAPFLPEMNPIFAIVSAFLIAAAGFSANDYFDAESDRLNKPKRPIAAGKTRKGAAAGVAGALFAAGMVLAYLISFDALAIAAVATGLLIAYSVALKNTVLIGNIVTGGLTGMAFFFGGVVAGNHIAALPVALFVLLSYTGKEIYKSIDNSLADKRYDEKSTAMRLGVTNSRIIANIFLIVAVIFSFVPYFLGMLGMTYLFFILMADIILLLSAVIPVKYSSKLVAAGIVVGVAAFLVGVAA